MKPFVWFVFLFISFPIIAEAKIWYVTVNGAGTKSGTSWNSALDDLQIAMTNAQSGDTIWVATGIHVPKNTLISNRNNGNGHFFGLNKNLKIFGGFIGNETSLSQRDWLNNVTVLSGDQNKNNLSNHLPTSNSNRTDDYPRVLVATRNLINAELDGFVIQHTYDSPNANQNLSFDNISINTDYYGVVIQNAAGLTLRNLIIKNHYNSKKTGLNIISSNVHVDNIYIEYNYSVSSDLNTIYSSTVSGKDIFIRNNISQQAAGLLFNSNSTANLQNITLDRNKSFQQSVLAINGSTHIQLNRVIIKNNNNANKSSVYINQTPVVLSNIIIHNDTTTSNTVGIDLNGSTTLHGSLKLINATLTKLYSSANGTKRLIDRKANTTLEVYNSILFQPNYESINGTASKAYNNYSNTTYSATDQEFNISSNMNPFLDYDQNNFMLGIGSIARNSGDSVYLLQALGLSNLVLQKDAYGSPRVNHLGKIDIGAIEDTLIDAILRNFKYSVSAKIFEQKTIIQLNIQEHEFQKLIIKASDGNQPMQVVQTYHITGNNQFVESLQIPHTNYLNYEWWVEDKMGQIFLLKKQTIPKPFTKVVISLYPNPTSNQLNIYSQQDPIQSIKIYDLSGKVKAIYHFNTPQSTYIISVDSFSPGVYLASIQTKNESQQLKFIKR